MSSNLVQINWEARKKVLFSNLSLFRRKEIHTDVTLSCEGENYAAHRLVLTMGSGYFAKAFEKNYKGISPSLVLVCGIRSCILKSLLGFIYDGSITIKSEDIADLSKAGIMLEVPGLIELGKEYSSISESMRVSNGNDNFEVSSQSSTSKDNNRNKTAPLQTTIIEEDILEVDPLNDIKESVSVDEQFKEYVIDEEIAKTVSVDTLFARDSCHSDNSISFEGWDNDKEKGDNRISFKGWDKEKEKRKLKTRSSERISTKRKKRSQRCNTCSENFYTLKSLEEHMTSHNTPPSYTCTFCKKSFRNKRHCKAHVFTHINEKENVVGGPDCSKSKVTNTDETQNETTENENVTETIRNGQMKGNNTESRRNSFKPKLDVESDRKFKRRKGCEDVEEYTIDDVLKSVSQSFKNLSHNADFIVHDDSIYDEGVTDEVLAFPNHPPTEGEESNSIHKLKETLNLKQSVSSVNTRVCRFCDSEFLNSKSFRKHRITDCKVLECPFCLASFETRTDYDDHTTVHEGIDRPYICSECTYRTDVKRSFEDHMSLHTGVFRFWCLLCDFQAKKLHELKAHTSSDHPEIDLDALEHLLSK